MANSGGMNAAAPLRAGVIGLGVGEQHAIGYRDCASSALVAICDVDPVKLREVARRFPGVRVSSEAHEILGSSDINVVSVASYDQHHFAHVRAALLNGKHVIVEKPAFMNRQEADEIRRILNERPSLRLTTNVPLRLEPRFASIRAMIVSGEFGEIFHLEGDYDYGRRSKLTDGWRGWEPGYSVILGGGIHLIDLLLWMSGRRVVEVAAAVGTSLATRGSKFAGMDTVTALMVLDNGGTMKVTSNFGSVSRHFHGLRVYGESATFINGLPDGIIYRQSDQRSEGKSERVTQPYPVATKDGLVREFIADIYGQASLAVSCDEVFERLAICFAIEEALATGRRITLR